MDVLSTALPYKRFAGGFSSVGLTNERPCRDGRQWHLSFRILMDRLKHHVVCFLYLLTVWHFAVEQIGHQMLDKHNAKHTRHRLTKRGWVIHAQVCVRYRGERIKQWADHLQRVKVVSHCLQSVNCVLLSVSSVLPDNLLRIMSSTLLKGLTNLHQVSLSPSLSFLSLVDKSRRI